MVYNSATNNLAEAFNKTIGKLLKKFVSKNQYDWDDKLGKCFWAYRTTIRTPTKPTPFFLVYRCEAVIPLEVQISSLCIALTMNMTYEEKHRLWLQELEALDDKHLQTQQQIELYQSWIFRPLNQKFRERIFKKGDLALAVRRPVSMTHKTKEISNPNGKDHL